MILKSFDFGEGICKQGKSENTKDKKGTETLVAQIFWDMKYFGNT